MASRRIFALVGALLLAGGCHSPVQEHVDLAVCELAARPLDAAVVPPPGSAVGTGAEHTLRPSGEPDARVHQAQYQAETPKPDRGAHQDLRPFLDRLRPPVEVPGSRVPPIELPGADMPKERKEAIDRLFPRLPDLGGEPRLQPGPEGRPMTLTDLQKLAMSNSPLIRQAAADVAAARGAAVQAGLYPNPTVGFEQDTAGTSGGPGYIGGFLEQTISTAGKIKLASAAAAIDLLNAEVALRRAQTDLTAQVRAAYFAVLMADLNIRVYRALAQFTEEAFRIQVEQVQVAQAAAYQPMQLRVLAVAARGNLVQARNRSTSAWKQLAATIGLPALPPTEMAGGVNLPIPHYYYEAVLAQTLAGHTEVQTAENTVRKARYNLRLVQVGTVPDVRLRVMLQKDFTGPPFELSPTVAASVPVPVWDRNQGNIAQSQGQLVRAVEESHRVRNDLTSRVAEAFERYENNRVLQEMYRDQILPDQVQVFRGVFVRYHQDPGAADFNDVVDAQIALAVLVGQYLDTTNALWKAVVDVANLLQTDDLYAYAAGQCPGTVPDLEHLLQLPCSHPCSPLHDPRLKGADGSWPKAVPGGAPANELPKPRPVEKAPAPAPVPELEPPPPIPRRQGGV